MNIIVCVLLALATAALSACGGQVFEKPTPSQPTTVAVKPQAAVPTVAVKPAATVPVAASKPQPVVLKTVAAPLPSTLESFKPFKQFKKGEGEGYAKAYKNRSKGEIVTLLRNPVQWKKEMRVSCEVWVQQIAEAYKHLNLPFEGCEGAAKALESDLNFDVVACRAEMFEKNNWLGVTNKDGSAFGAWHRKCYVGEQVLIYKDQTLASVFCMNTVAPTTLFVTSVLAAPTAAARCVELTFNALVGGKVLWGVGSSTGPPLPPDACNAQKEGDGPWQAWHEECETCVPQEGYISKLLGSTAQVPHKYKYPVSNAKQTFRFSSEIWKKVLYFCLEDKQGKKSCGSYVRPESWKDRNGQYEYRVQILNKEWVWDEKQCLK